jgi:hypothetical protein
MNETKCAATSVEPLNNIAVDIIEALTGAKNASAAIGDRLFLPSPDNCKSGEESYSLEQRLQLIRAMSIELRAKLSNIADRI